MTELTDKQLKDLIQLKEAKEAELKYTACKTVILELRQQIINLNKQIAELNKNGNS